MDWYGIGAMVIGFLGLFIGIWRLDSKKSVEFARLMTSFTSGIQKELEKNPMETPPQAFSVLEGRVSAIERRQEELEADCKRYLAKANTRLRRAQQLSGEEEYDDETASEEQIQQALPFLQGARPQSEENGPYSLDYIKQLARSRG